MLRQLYGAAVLLAVDRDSSAYTAGRIFGDLLLLGITIALIVTGFRREREGRNGAPWYVVGGVLLLLLLATFARRGAQ